LSFNSDASFTTGQNMLVSVLFALFLPCVGMSVVFFIYICLLWYAANNQPENIPLPVKTVTEKGLSSSELEKLPKVTGKELVLGTECAVCLDDIESEQLARIVPGCNHGFHLECADTWLSKHPVCPVCRAKLDAQFSSTSASPENNPC
jgi:E3 ubiquitin-protein ligase ATL23